MQRLTRARTVLALALVGALALAGCGGDDNNGVEQDLRDQVAMLEGQLSDAETAKAAADAAKMTAEAAAADAMTAQTAAEAERDAANTAKGAAEQAQATAEATQMTAEEAQMAAEAAQMTAEAAQTEAEKMQAAAEAERDAASGSLAAAEMARDAAKDAEAAAKVAQAHAEATKMSAEADSADAMVAQMAAEAAQMAAVEAQTAAEDKAAEYKKMADDAETAQMAAEEAQTAAEDKAAEYKKMADDAETARMAAEEAQTAAEDKAAEYKKMADDAETAQMAAEEAQTAAEDKAKMYMDELAALRGDVDDTTAADRNAAAKALLAVLMNNDVEYTLPAHIAAASQPITDPAAPETAADYNKTGLVSTALVAKGADDPDADPTPTTAASDERQRVANDVSALMVEVSSDGMLMAKVRDNAAYMPPDTTPDMIEGWRGAMLTRDQADGTMDTVVVYSNIGDDGMESLLDRYESTRPTTTKPRNWEVAILRLFDDGTLQLDSDEAGKIPWSEVERPDTTTSFTGTDVAMLTFKGTVHDIPGTFSCTRASSCRAPDRYSDGKVEVTAESDLAVDSPSGGALGTWTFVPDEGVSLFTDDTTYLTFGWWLDKNSGGNPADFRAFSTASAAMGDARVQGAADRTSVGDSTYGTYLRGSATYKGAAAGKYATASTALSAAYEGGHFTADATLEVNFDADLDGNSDTAGDNTAGVAVSGMINNFMTGDTSRPDWNVKLMANTPLVSLAGNDTATMTTEWSTGGAAKGTGDWTAAWYGGTSRIAGEAGEDDTLDVGIPTAVIGTFDAAIGTAARLQGAFGAMQEME